MKVFGEEILSGTRYSLFKFFIITKNYDEVKEVNIKYNTMTALCFTAFQGAFSVDENTHIKIEVKRRHFGEIRSWRGGKSFNRLENLSTIML